MSENLSDLPPTDNDADPTSIASPAGEENSHRRGRRARPSISAIALIVALGVSAALAAWIYTSQIRGDRAVDPAAAKTVLESATNGAIAVLSYSPQSLDNDLSTAKSHMTGEFLNYYTNFTDQVVRQAVRDKSVKTSAAVVRGAVSELHPDSATVLLFVNQTTTSRDRPDGAFSSSSVRVTMTKVGGSWLISAFDPA